MPMIGGYGQAMSEISQADERSAWVQQALQQIAKQKWLQQQIEQQDAERRRDAASAGRVMYDMGQQQPQPPMPGAPSVPMMPPGQPLAAPPGGMPPSPMMAPPPQQPGAGPGMAAPGAAPAVPPGWKPSPQMMGGPPGAPPGPGMGAGAAPPLATPPGAPPPPGAPAGGGMPSAGQSGWVRGAIEKMKASGIPAEQAIGVLEQMMPAMEAQNKSDLAEARIQNQALQEAVRSYKAYIDAHREGRLSEGTTPTATGRDAVAAGLKPGTPEYEAAMRQKLEKDVTPPGGGAKAPGNEIEPLTPGGLKVAADLTAAGRPLPGGWSKTGQSRGNAVLNQMARDQEAGGEAPTTKMAAYKADAGSLALQQKRVDGIEGSMKKIDKDITTLESVLDKGAFSNAKVLNTPINVLRRQMSDPDLAKLDLAANQVGTEYERLLTGGMLSIAQLHVGAQEDAKKLISGDMAPKEIRAKLPVMRREMQNAKEAATEQLNEIKGRMRGGTAKGETPLKRPDGSILMADKNGNRAYVKDGKVIEMVP